MINSARLATLFLFLTLNVNSILALGIEIGNGSIIPNAGVEIGNGSFISVPGLFSIKRLVGKWKVDNQFQFLKLTTEEKLSPKLEATFQVYYAPNLQTAADLFEECFFGEWEILEGLSELNAIKKQSRSKTNQQITQIKIFKKTQQFLYVEVVGNGRETEAKVIESLKSLNFED